MPEDPRFLLGHGESLTERIPPPKSGGGSDPAYSMDEAVSRLNPMVRELSDTLQHLPRGACPEGEAVGVITLHPQWMAKSYHPQALLTQFNLRQIGSRPVQVQPEKWSRQEDPTPSPSTELFVAGKRESFRDWARTLRETPKRVTPQIRRLEAVRAPQISERLRNISGGQDSILLEVVLHASEAPAQQYIVTGFVDYANTLGVDASLERRLYAGGLCFMPVEAPADSVGDLARFSFLRVARPVPRMRSIAPVERSVFQPALPASPLPEKLPVDVDLRVAVFDGGLDNSSPLAAWATPAEAQGVEEGDPALYEHGHAVTSAVLFGSLEPGKPAPQPYARVDHYRVLDNNAGGDPYELYDVLNRIKLVLRERQYEFFNLSLGPYLPVEDDEVHPWTALLDEHLSDGHALATVAVGNNGEEDRFSGQARIQVPSDCVNALSIGAADTARDGWKRADYSALGPGRAPGKVKPDVLHFGGSTREPFMVYDTENAPGIAMTTGTSFASPAALRLAAGVRAHFGERLSPLALRALLIHSANKSSHESAEVGWGRLPADLDELVLCSDGMVRVVYQGELSPSQYLRAPIPLPDNQLVGYVELSATFCYASPIDPQDPGSYTRSGLDITFRPHADRFPDKNATDPTSKAFFRRSDYDTEKTLRQDAQKWETTLHAERRFRGTSLHIPVFDIHYNARFAGGPSRSADKMKYALVVTVRSAKTPDLYDRVLARYAGRLEAIQPVIEIPIRVQ